MDIGDNYDIIYNVLSLLYHAAPMYICNSEQGMVSMGMKERK